jgi:uroporphyrinogen III methyltransferase/synthase
MAQRRLRILVTRPADQAQTLTQRLTAIGVEPVPVPTVAILPPASFEALDAALLHLARYDSVVFTSRNGVQAFFERHRALGISDPHPISLRWAAIGPGTAEALATYGVTRAWMPSRYLSEAVGDELPARAGERVLRVRAEVASSAPAERLRARGAMVDEVVAYRAQEAPEEAREPLRQAWARGLDGVIFTSASTVRGLIRLAEDVGLKEQMRNLFAIGIGPVTAREISAAGWTTCWIAEDHSLDGLMQFFTERGESSAAAVRTDQAD